MAPVLLSVELGAAGRPTLSYLIEKAMGTYRTAPPPPTTSHTLPPIPEATILPPGPSERETLKIKMLRTMRPLPLQYCWTFSHSSTTPSTTSAAAAHQLRQLTTLMDGITTIKTFWEVHNQFPLRALPANHSIHFFKRGVQPLWEDERNIKGGAWTFRVPKAHSGELWMEILLLAVGEQFADVIHPGDDLCGISLTNSAQSQSNHDVITIWNRDGSNRASIDGILSVVLEKVSLALGLKQGLGVSQGQGLRGLSQGLSCEYKKHSDRPGFGQAVAAAAGLARWAQFSCSS